MIHRGRTLSGPRALLLSAGAASTLVLAACGLAGPSLPRVGVGPPPAPPTTAAPAPPPATEPPPVQAVDGASAELPLFFIRDGKLGVARRTFALDLTVADRTLQALLAGPTPAEEQAGLTTAIPALSRVRGTALMGDVVVINLAGSFAALGPESSGQLRVAQIIYTMTVFPVKILFQIDGQPARTVSGYTLPDRPLTRDDFADWAPPILLESVGPDEVLTPSSVISGSTSAADVGVGVRVTDGAGQVLFEGTTRSAKGHGTRHPFTTLVPFPAATPGPGTLTLWEATPPPGATPLVLTIPVMLG